MSQVIACVSDACTCSSLIYIVHISVETVQFAMALLRIQQIGSIKEWGSIKYSLYRAEFVHVRTRFLSVCVCVHVQVQVHVLENVTISNQPTLSSMLHWLGK